MKAVFVVELDDAGDERTILRVLDLLRVAVAIEPATDRVTLYLADQADQVMGRIRDGA